MADNLAASMFEGTLAEGSPVAGNLAVGMFEGGIPEEHSREGKGKREAAAQGKIVDEIGTEDYASWMRTQNWTIRLSQGVEK